MQIENYFKKKNKIKIPIIELKNYNILQKIVTLVKSSDVEIMMLGIIEKQKNTYIIEDILIPPMDKNSTAFVTTNDEKFGEWLYKIPREIRKKLRLHIHTHPKMVTNPSQTDNEMIEDKIENISDFYIRMIINQDLEFHVDFFDLKQKLKFKEITLSLPTKTKYGTVLTLLSKKGISTQFLPNKNKTKQILNDLQNKIQKPINYEVYTSYPYVNNNNDNFIDNNTLPLSQNLKSNPLQEKYEKLIIKYNLALDDFDLFFKIQEAFTTTQEYLIENNTKYIPTFKDYLKELYQIDIDHKKAKRKIKIIGLELAILRQHENENSKRPYTTENFIATFDNPETPFEYETPIEYNFLQEIIHWYLDKPKKTKVTQKEMIKTLETWENLWLIS